MKPNEHNPIKEYIYSIMWYGDNTVKTFHTYETLNNKCEKIENRYSCLDLTITLCRVFCSINTNPFLATYFNKHSSAYILNDSCS